MTLFTKGHHLSAITTHANIYALHNIAMEIRPSFFHAASFHIATGHSKGRPEKLMTPSPLLSLPSARIISNSELIKFGNPGLEQYSVRRATAEKIILIWVSELIMCNTVSSFHNKFTTLQDWIELKSFPLCLFKDKMYPSHLQPNVQLRIAHGKKD